MFQRAEEDLMNELKSIIPQDLVNKFTDPGYRSVQGFLYVAVAAQRGQNPGSKMHPTDPYNYALFDIADWTCLPVYIILDSFLPVIQPTGVPICKQGYFGKLNLREDVLSPREKFTQDKIVLLERLLPEFMFMANILDPTTNKPVEVPGQDELTKGVLRMVCSKEIPIVGQLRELSSS